MKNNQGYGSYFGTDEMLSHFSNWNNCNHKNIDTIPNFNRAENTFIIKNVHTNNNSLVPPIISYKVINGGHDWPGSSGTNCVDASKEIACFFMDL